LSATLTIEVSTIAMIRPSIVVRVTRMTGTPPVSIPAARAGRSATRDAMTCLPPNVRL
jgi:hypothetical protein